MVDALSSVASERAVFVCFTLDAGRALRQNGRVICKSWALLASILVRRAVVRSQLSFRVANSVSRSEGAIRAMFRRR